MALGHEATQSVPAVAVIDPIAIRSIVRVRLDVIDATERLREVDEAYAHVIAASMVEHEKSGGRRQLQPIEIVARGDGYRLVFGAHRVRAHQINGWDEIDAEVVSMSDVQLRLREIDENLIRAELTALDRARFLLERKRIYEAVNPEAKHGANQHTRGDANLATPSFGEDIAEKTGFSYRTIARACALAEGLSPDAIKALRDSPLARNQAALEALSKHPHARQMEAIGHMFADANPAKSVAEAFDRIDGKAVKPATELKLARAIDAYARLSAKEKREFQVIHGLVEAGK